MSAPSTFTPQEQYAALCILDLLSDLFTIAGKEEFSRVDVLSILANVRDDADLFDPECVIAQQIATQEFEG